MKKVTLAGVDYYSVPTKPSHGCTGCEIPKKESCVKLSCRGFIYRKTGVYNPLYKSKRSIKELKSPPYPIGSINIAGDNKEPNLPNTLPDRQLKPALNYYIQSINAFTLSQEKELSAEEVDCYIERVESYHKNSDIIKAHGLKILGSENSLHFRITTKKLFALASSNNIINVKDGLRFYIDKKNYNCKIYEGAI